MEHDFRTIQTHIKLVFQRKLKQQEWIEIAYSPNGARTINKAVWINSKQHLEKLKELENCNLSIGNSLRIGKTRKEGSEARATTSDCGERLVQIFDIENEKEHKTTREQGKFIPKDTVKKYIYTFLNNIKPVYNGNPLYTAYTGGGGQVGIRLTRELPPKEQKPFNSALKLVLNSNRALIEKDNKTGKIINPIGADPSRFDITGLQRLIGSYNYERNVQTYFFEINRDSKPLDVDDIFKKAKQIKAEEDKNTMNKSIPSAHNSGEWRDFIDQKLEPRIKISQLLQDLGWNGKDKGRHWEFHCNFHPPRRQPFIHCLG